MIISDSHKFIYYDLPKTGSCSLDRVFSRYGKCIPKALNNKKHNRIVPKNKENYYKIASIRNPYERAISFYHQGLAKNFDIAKKSLDALLDHLVYCALNGEPNDLSTLIGNHFPIWKYLYIVEPIDYYIKLEYIQEDLNNIPLNINKNLPHLNKRNHPKFKDYINQERLEKINIWAGQDFKKYNYKRYEDANKYIIDHT